MQTVSGLPEAFSPESYDMIVVGAGYAGAVCARRLAETAGFRVAVLERRDHIAGNAFDFVNDEGILVHRYGPHIYHTYNEDVHGFLSRFTKWTDYQHRVLADIDGTLMPVPFNHQSLLLAFGETRGEELYRKLISTFGADKKVPIMELRKKNDPDLIEVADYVYKNVFLFYTMKQWGQTPDEIDPSITGRVPIYIGDDDRYFPQAPFQGMPRHGYTALFENLLDHDRIDVFLNVDAREIFEITETTVKVLGRVYGGEIVYTGPLDELFGLDLGALPYRTLDMRFETLDIDRFQPVATVNYTTSEDFTRITEFKNMTGQIVPDKTTIMREYPGPYAAGTGQTPYYAIIDSKNRELYEQYAERVQNLTNFHPVGRLAEYRYYDMDAVTRSALDLSDEIIAYHA
ncbi:UDP-galactopyranose mutase [Coriobacterium glomerans PW2]|uniref:UDP-galactopyranose mutase n=1 Tax=Coriobacterium glomerans (strain ATCC 49209 / DSM 20642 / JCM 10262 / PW2) TaxID=700015 RepID=F2NBP8_CORGP|nr:UDP-galactopyranose mutase [Coriobacterium glomerans]AEB06857.1 UDP-galactopyranose mutase [Coriobacterium glomerans PW2]